MRARNFRQLFALGIRIKAKHPDRSVPYVMAACYAGMNISECGDERQKRELLPRVASGDMIFAYGWSEPDVGADIASVRTTAQRHGKRSR